MYRRIEELAEGKVHNHPPIPVFEPQQLELELVEGTNANGRFMIRSMNNTPMRGMIYSTDLRMELKHSQFQGMEAEIRYEFHGEYMQEGEVAVGDFLIICNSGEYNLSWSVSARRLYAESSVGRIAKLDDFLKLYRANWRESMYVFSAPGFKKLLKSPGELLHYRLLSEKPVLRANIEEFLIGCKKKERVTFALTEQEQKHELLMETIDEYVTVTLSDWGYIEIEVSCEEPFVTIEKTMLNTDDFNGNTYQFHYQIHPELMHGGRNFARIVFQNFLQQESFSLEATLGGVRDLEREDRHQQAVEDLKLARYYEQFLAGEIVLGEWAKNTTKLLKSRIQLEIASDYDQLWCAYAFLQNHQNQEAAWILDDYKHEHEVQETPEWAFFLYLCSLTETETALRDKLYQKIREIYRKHHDDIWMRFVIMQIAERSSEVYGKQLWLMQQWFDAGLKSPFLYARAAEIFENEPYLLLRIGRFELHILEWICRHRRLTRDLSEQIMRRAVSVTVYDKRLDKVLVACYEAYPEIEQLAGVCAYRIKGQQFGRQAHEWYELAIEHDLQITGLYEAYMASLDPREVKQLPKTLQLYFQYNNRLTYRQKAVLYVNIIAHKDEQPTVYNRYQQIMQDFTVEQIMAGHMDDNLSIVYSHVLDKMPLTEELARALASILYVNKFTCLDVSVTHAVVLHENLRQSAIYPIINHQAYFPVYPGNYVVLLQDKHGLRHVLSEQSQMERLMNPGRYIRKSLELAPDKLPYILHHMNGKTKLLHMDERMAEFVRRLVDSPEITDEYKSKIGPGFLEYCRGEGLASEGKNYILKINYGKMERGARDRYLDSLIHLRMYDEAWAFLLQYGVGRLSGESLQLVVLAQLDKQNMQEDDDLLFFTTKCFMLGSRKKPVVEYLCSYYQGPAVRMVEIWREAVRQNIDAKELEERLLIQMVFSTAFTPDVQKVFADYCSKQGREQVRMAYLTYFSYEVFVNHMAVEPELYHYLEQVTLLKSDVNDYLKLALFEYYTTEASHTGAQERFMDDVLDEFLGKNICFACFLQVPEKMLIRHHLYDRYVVEYRSSVPDSAVYLHYRLSGSAQQFEQVLLKPQLSNIHLWNICLLADEQLEYYISEKSDRMENIMESHAVELPGIDTRRDNRFCKLSRIVRYTKPMEDGTLHTDELVHQMERYQAYQSLTEKLFRVL